jgi:hypothetical protein
MAERQRDDRRFFDQPIHGWPPRRVVMSCQADRGPLLTRYYLIDTRWFALYLHHLHVSDEDRALHDHPWSFVTCLLSAGYYEHTPIPSPTTCTCGHSRPGPPCPRHYWRGQKSVRTWWPRFSVLYRSAEWRHRLELVKPTWTLVVRFRRRREWGFITPSGWQQWEAYGKEWCD